MRGFGSPTRVSRGDPRVRAPARFACAACTLLGLLWVGCELQADPESRAVEVVTSTTGDDPDADGYEVLLDGSDARPVPPDGSVRFANLPTGSHEIELRDVASNCTVQGEHPRPVQVDFGAEAVVEIEILCRARRGEVEVRTSTSGEAPDPDGYTVTVAGESRDAPTNGVVTFRSVPSGERQVSLAGIASNCAVDGDNPRTVTVPSGGGTVSTTFWVVCERPTGDLRVEAETGGTNLDPDGYEVRVDGGSPRSLEPNGSVTYEDLPSGDHEVELSGVAANCAVEGENPRTVRVPTGGDRVTTTFSVECFPGGGGD